MTLAMVSRTEAQNTIVYGPFEVHHQPKDDVFTQEFWYLSRKFDDGSGLWNGRQMFRLAFNTEEAARAYVPVVPSVAR